jgi:FkbM family methyltransferase
MLQGKVPGMEQAIFGIAETHLKSSPSQGWVIDAGANIGLFTYLGITLNHSVVAIDPVTEHVEMLRRSASMNGIPNERMIVLQNAISGHCGRAKIDFGHKMKNPGGSSIAWKEPSSKSEAASVVTMSEVFAFTRGAPVHLLKIDVEGQEPWLLNGMPWITRPRMIVMELFNPRILSHGCSIRRIFEQLVITLHYKLRVFPRLALHWDSNTIVATEEELERLMRVIKRESEMDVILY